MCEEPCWPRFIIWGKNFQAAAQIQNDTSKARKLILFLHFSAFPHGITFVFLLVCWFPGLWRARSQSFLSPNVSRGGPQLRILLSTRARSTFFPHVCRGSLERGTLNMTLRRAFIPNSHKTPLLNPPPPPPPAPPHPLCPTLYLTLTICRVSAKNPIRLIWNSPGERTLSFWRIDN